MLNSEAQGLTLAYYDNNDRGWMLYKWDIKIHSFPKFNETLRITTHPSAFKNFLANREYQIFNSSGNLLVEAQSVWMFVNTKTRRPLLVPEEMYTKFDVGKESGTLFYKLDELPAIANGNCTLKINIRNSDIDTNRHVNNVRYVDWAIESLPKEFTDTHTVTRIQVNYKKELNLGDEADIVSDVTGEISQHSIICSGKEICHLRLFWNKD
jgi:medium-chain acyl-[acyl-carrier-protein] hydrolase